MSRLLITALVFVGLVLVAVVVQNTLANSAPPGAPVEPGATPSSTPEGGAPITSADPTAPVPFRWTTVETHTSGSFLHVQGGTLHAIPSAVRLLGPSGAVVAEGEARPVAAGEPGLCGEEYAGMVAAELSVPSAVVDALGTEWDAAYRLEAQVGGEWRATALTFAGCIAME